MKNVSIVVPVYADWSSLKLNIASLKKYYGNKAWVKIYYVNDHGPESQDLENKITKSIKNTSNFYYHANKHNLGFVKNCNNAVFNIIEQNGDVLLLNSDTKVTEGFLEELVRILYSDESIGIVNPRSSNATVWSVPMDARLADKPKKSFEYWKKLKKHIPEKYISPTSHGFCMLIRRQIINEIGLFDEIYGKGYGEENDFTMRALKNGWKCAVANYAYVFHFESKSFGADQRIELYNKNRKTLLKRYPNYENMVSDYIQRTVEPRPVNNSPAWRVYSKSFKAIEYGHYNGYGVMLGKALACAKKKSVGSKAIQTVKSTEPKIKIWSHELSNTGAPLVLLDVVEQIRSNKKIYDKVEFYYPSLKPPVDTYVEKLGNLGITPIVNEVHQKRFNPGDIILLNSAGYEAWFFDDLLTNIENKTIKHVFWYIHEDSEKWASPFWDHINYTAGSPDEVATVNRYKRICNRFKEAIDAGNVTVFAPSSSSAKNWQTYFDTERHFNVMPGRVMIEQESFIERSNKDFEIINFAIAGTVEPRKNQLPVICAIECFYNTYYLKNPKMYRDFSLNIIGLSDNVLDFYNTSVINASNRLNEKIILHPKTSQKKTYEILGKANFTITYSLAESFSMVTIEGMALGHPIIRSECSGQEEQLMPGVNGWPVSTEYWYGLVEAVEEVLNKDKTSNENLAQMSKESVNIATQNRREKYKLIDDLEKLIELD